MPLPALAAISPQPLSGTNNITAIFNVNTQVLTVIGTNMEHNLPHLVRLYHSDLSFIHVFDIITPDSNGHFEVSSFVQFPLDLHPFPETYLIRVEVSGPPASTWAGDTFEWYFEPPEIITNTLPNGTVGVVYPSVTLEADYDGKSTPRIWSVKSGNFPPGLTLSPGGGVSGTPLQPGTFTFTVKFGNSAAFDTEEFTIIIAPAPPVSTQHTVTIVNGGTGYAVTGGPNHTAGSNVTINAGTRVGFVFNGWTFSPAVTLAAGHSAATTSTTFVMPAQNVVATANWVAAPPQGGSGVGSGNWGGGGVTQRPPTTQPPTNQTPPPTDQAPELHLLFMIGDDMGNFRPQAPITRAEAATVLARVNLLDFETGIDFLPEGMSAFNTFADVNSSDWFYHYVAWAYSDGLIRGDSPDGGARYFRPNDPITRQEFAAILARTAESLTTGDTPFADADNVADWAQDYVFTTYTLGHMIGDGANHFRPATNVNRAEVATAISRLLGRIADRANFYSADVVNVYQAIAFPDVSEAAWYFPATLSATNDQYLTRANGVVDWKEFVTTRQ